MKKTEYTINTEKLASELSKESPVYNWLISAGVEKFNTGKIGNNMIYFLTSIGILESRKVRTK